MTINPSIPPSFFGARPAGATGAGRRTPPPHPYQRGTGPGGQREGRNGHVLQGEWIRAGNESGRANPTSTARGAAAPTAAADARSARALNAYARTTAGEWPRLVDVFA